MSTMYTYRVLVTYPVVKPGRGERVILPDGREMISAPAQDWTFATATITIAATDRYDLLNQVVDRNLLARWWRPGGRSDVTVRVELADGTVGTPAMQEALAAAEGDLWDYLNHRGMFVDPTE